MINEFYDVKDVYCCFDRSTVDDLWEMAASKIAPVLLTCTQSVRELFITTY